MKTIGRKQVDMKKWNRGQILKLIATGTCNNRGELAVHMGMTKMAITNMVSELTQKSLLEESGVNQNDGVGRKSIGLRISGKAPKIIGLLILRDRCEAVLCDFHLNILYRKTVSLINPGRQELLDLIYNLIDELQKVQENILGIGISCIGPIDITQGMILNPPYFFGLKNIPIVSLLEDRYSLPVFMDHDNQNAALAEFLYGNGRKRDSFMLLGLSRGVGCGIVKNGVLYVDSHNLAPEVGHVSIDYQGKKCVCGNRGCIELYVNTEEVLTRLREATGLSHTFREFCELQENPAVGEIFEDVVEKLSLALVSTINLLNLELILLGYDGVYLPEKYVKKLEIRINETRFSGERSETTVRKTHFGEDSQLLGSVCKVLREVFDGRMLLD